MRRSLVWIGLSLTSLYFFAPVNISGADLGRDHDDIVTAAAKKALNPTAGAVPHSHGRD